MEFKNIGEILEKTDTILLTHLMLNDEAMKVCHFIGYNGFKRMHRWNAKCFLGLHLMIENLATDRHKMLLDAHVGGLTYRPAGLKDHFVKWGAKLEEDIYMLGQLNNAYCNHTGSGCCIIEKAITKMAKNNEKTTRWIKRFDESNWNPHDLHSLDDDVHLKYKAIEKK